MFLTCHSDLHAAFLGGARFDAAGEAGVVSDRSCKEGDY